MVEEENREEENNEEEEEKEDKLADFGSKILRGPRGDVFQRLVSQYLILSVTAKPIESILHICRAALMVQPEKRKELQINETDLEILHVVSLNFQSALESKMDEEPKINLYWGFEESEENFRKYIKPWLQGYSYIEPFQWEHYPKLREQFKSKPFVERFFWASRNQSDSSFQHLVNSFLRWAVPRSQRISESVSQLINPLTYNEILQLFGRQQRQGEREQL